MLVGFGGYRISSRSQEHKESLKKALDFGCSLIDTSSNYTDGESEKLIGEVLAERDKKPLLISKAGYIQGSNLERFEELNAEKDLEHVEFNEKLMHSIDPAFLKDQLDLSLKRLGVDSLDGYLLHNPEYFLKKHPGNKEEFYKNIQKAFKYLGEEVSRGRIKAYGVSSNTLVSPREDEDATDLERLLRAAELADSKEYFKYLQFPMNLAEMNALQPQYNGKNLIQRAKDAGLITIANRPLNAFTSSGLLRLASYPVNRELTSNPEEMFGEKTKNLYKAWEESSEEGDESIEEVPLFLQIKNIWHKQTSEDAVQQIFFGHLFPFIARVYGRDLNPVESSDYYDLYEAALEHARANMNQRAETFAAQAEASGLLEKSDKSLSVRAMEKYRETGIDYVLVGMKRPEYVEEMKDFF